MSEPHAAPTPELDALRRQAVVLETMHDAVFLFDRAGRIDHANGATARMLQRPAEELIGSAVPVLLRPLEAERTWTAVLDDVLLRGRWTGDMAFPLPEGAEGTCEMTLVEFDETGSGGIAGFVAVARDTTERRMMERQLIQSQKFEAIGQLAAGVAHEINTPAQYVADNLHFLDEAFRQLLSTARRWRTLEGAESGPSEADLDWLDNEVPNAIRQSLEGMNRIAEIVRGVKTFGHPGGGRRSNVDLNAAIATTVAVSRNEWKYVAELETDLDPDLPLVPAYDGEIHHVLLNVIVNAAQAISECSKPDGKGHIRITSRHDGDWVEIRVSDDGPGIPAKVQPRIFDPFFTTKPVGRGTGQGLAICHRLVVDRLRGQLAFETSLGRGTTFIIRLPLGREGEAVRGAA